MVEPPHQVGEEQRFQGLAQERGVERQRQPRGRDGQQRQRELRDQRGRAPQAQRAREHVHQQHGAGGGEHAQGLHRPRLVPERGQRRGQHVEGRAVREGDALPGHLARPGARAGLVLAGIEQHRAVVADGAHEARVRVHVRVVVEGMAQGHRGHHGQRGRRPERDAPGCRGRARRGRVPRPARPAGRGSPAARARRCPAPPARPAGPTTPRPRRPRRRRRRSPAPAPAAGTRPRPGAARPAGIARRPASTRPTGHTRVTPRTSTQSRATPISSPPAACERKRSTSGPRHSPSGTSRSLQPRGGCRHCASTRSPASRVTSAGPAAKRATRRRSSAARRWP